ncbi:hypothetical protein KUCAC02_022333 [Chaenocephalus aceratus]|uniref:Uncharacterized protein n=1 Tax=Chaenocephalus aceratus TaxID=36190 RepID=A0ACB9XLN2_CHAAC|nr:hypothetical protein KUCAC02_022333 [Chaenocephalus aceratus]
MSVRAAARCCGRRAVVRLLGARDGVRGAVVSVEKENWGGGRKKGHNGIPELPDGRLASKTTDSCFPLMLSPTGGDGNEERGRGRESESFHKYSPVTPPLMCVRVCVLRVPEELITVWDYGSEEEDIDLIQQHRVNEVVSPASFAHVGMVTPRLTASLGVQLAVRLPLTPQAALFFLSRYEAENKLLSGATPRVQMPLRNPRTAATWIRSPPRAASVLPQGGERSLPANGALRGGGERRGETGSGVESVHRLAAAGFGRYTWLCPQQHTAALLLRPSLTRSQLVCEGQSDT